jgi:DNA protecting protein DprA
MPELTDDELCLVALTDTEGVGPASMAALGRLARGRGEPLHRTLAMGPEALEREAGLAPGVAAALGDAGDPRLHGRAVLEEAARTGTRVVCTGRPDYPSRLTALLGEQAPPVLFLRGECSLLEAPCVAVVGSRRPTRWAQDAARALAGQLAQDGMTIVSGGADGIDTAAHRAALLEGGTAFVPPVGLAQFRWHGARGRRLTRRTAGWCMVGQFPLQSGWRTAQALMRNRTIVALSEAVVAFEPRDGGGTWHSSVNALRMRRPLYVVCASARGAKARGQARLVRMGAVAIDPVRMPDAAAFRRMVAEYRVPPVPEQVSLFDGA